LKSAGSARFQGTETDGANSATIDLQLVPDGAVGTIKQSGLTINLVNTGGSSYIKAPTAYFTSGGAAAADAATVANKWVKLPASATSFAEFTLNQRCSLGPGTFAVMTCAMLRILPTYRMTSGNVRET
jgi:hypothetical protein